MIDTVNMSKAVKGSTVHFRCGGSATVYAKDHTTDGATRDYCNRIYFEPIEEGKMRSSEIYLDCGRVGGTGVSSPFDIVSIDPPPFDWKDVKPGMAFNLYDIQGMYVGKSLEGFAVMDLFSDANRFGLRFVASLECHLTRTPEYDKEIK